MITPFQPENWSDFIQTRIYSEVWAIKWKSYPDKLKANVHFYVLYVISEWFIFKVHQSERGFETEEYTICYVEFDWLIHIR